MVTGARTPGPPHTLYGTIAFLVTATRLGCCIPVPRRPPPFPVVGKKTLAYLVPRARSFISNLIARSAMGWGRTEEKPYGEKFQGHSWNQGP
jgi:hypothetical protein